MDRRDRHGRGMRGPLARPPVPLAATRRELFADVVLLAAEQVGEALEELTGQSLEEVAFAVEDVPRIADGEVLDAVPLGRTVAASGDTPATVVIYRRTIEERTDPGPDREEVVRAAVALQVGELFGVDPDELI